MQMNFIQTYQDIKGKGMDIKRGHLDDGAIKHYKESSQDRPNNDRSRYWNKIKNVVTDGATNTKHVQVIVISPNPPLPTYQQQAPTYQQLVPTYQQSPCQLPVNQANGIYIP